MLWNQIGSIVLCFSGKASPSSSLALAVGMVIQRLPLDKSLTPWTYGPQTADSCAQSHEEAVLATDSGPGKQASQSWVERSHYVPQIYLWHPLGVRLGLTLEILEVNKTQVLQFSTC